MQEEIEVKYIDVDHKQLRAKLEDAGAVCVSPMRLMRRAVIDFPDSRLQTSDETGWGWVRIRDEGDRITCTYKHIAHDGNSTTHEIEYTVSSYTKAVQLFEAIGLKVFSEQETKRETWELNKVEIDLDEWPWIPPYIEIEGPTEQAIKEVSLALGFDWETSLRGSSDRVYRHYYPKMGQTESVTDIQSLTFSGNMPQFLAERA